MNYSYESFVSSFQSNQPPVGYDSNYPQQGPYSSSHNIPNTSVASSSSRQPLHDRSDQILVQEQENIPDTTNSSLAKTSQQSQDFNRWHTRHPMTDANHDGFQEIEAVPALFNAEWPLSMTVPRNTPRPPMTDANHDGFPEIEAAPVLFNAEWPPLMAFARNEDLLNKYALYSNVQNQPDVSNDYQPLNTEPQYSSALQGYQASASAPALDQLGPVRHSHRQPNHSLPYQRVGSSNSRLAQDNIDSFIQDTQANTSSSVENNQKVKKPRRKVKVRPTLSTVDSIKGAFQVTMRASDSRARALRPNTGATLGDVPTSGSTHPNGLVSFGAEDLPMIPCPLAGCTAASKGIKALEKHLAEAHEYRRKKTRDQNSVVCPIYGCIVKVGEGNLNRHIAETHTNVWYYCTMCDTGRSRQDDLKNHFETVHAGYDVPKVFREILHESAGRSM
ncbi:hypothetical protein JR316_0007351 [Psilocybe cubensis]|uniref:C2H2-type domain-containing protein n=2 Tax=Psilocybe cubensis TaxID=181762 RepID=A0A8H7XSS8_PSICU|nr:hypothetical protein JR316_0007351 [Psilocybe cubensis]KAH9480751.1 hypothetical protein JR316_0007351 [Psilocybe cubensis]